MKKRRGGGNKNVVSNKVPSKETSNTNESSDYTIYIIIVGLLFLGGIIIYLNYDYLLCRSMGRGHDFCTAKVNTMDDSEDRAQRRDEAK